VNAFDRDFDFDPFDERFFDDPYPYYRELRQRIGRISGLFSTTDK